MGNKIDLPLLSIEAAEELQRFSLKKNTDLKQTIELSALIKENFSKRLDYQLLFTNAYFATYGKRINLGHIKEYSEEISEKLSSPLSLNDTELEKLVNFCANLSDYSALNQREIDNLKGPCFK